MYTKKRAVHRLTLPLPGTAEIGNWGVLKGAKKVGMKSSTIVSRKRLLEVAKGEDEVFLFSISIKWYYGTQN